MLVALGGLLCIAAFVCGIIVLIDAFKNEIWKGVVMLLCGIYGLYYGLVEFEHEHKWPIVLTWLIAGFAGSVLMSMGLASSVSVPSSPVLP